MTTTQPAPTVAELRELADLVEYHDLDDVVAALDMPSGRALDICGHIADLARAARTAAVALDAAATLAAAQTVAQAALVAELLARADECDKAITGRWARGGYALTDDDQRTLRLVEALRAVVSGQEGTP